MKRKPDFLIVGAMKSGTTELLEQLRLQPHVDIVPHEVHFFDNDRNYQLGHAWYLSQLALCRDVAAIGEKTPTYSYTSGPLAKIPERIYEFIPDTKLIWIFRDPISRTYSNYWHAVKAGTERLSFGKAIDAERRRRKKSIWRGYVDRSKYVVHIETYLKYFPIEQMHFMLFERFVQDMKGELARLCSFLGVPFSPEDVRVKPGANQTLIPRSRHLLWGARKALAGRPQLFRRVQSVLQQRTPGYPRMDERLRSRLEDEFEPYNRRLAQLAGLDLSVWPSYSRRGRAALVHGGS